MGHRPERQSVTSRFQNFSNFVGGIGFKKKLYKKSIGIGFENFWHRKKVLVSALKILVSKNILVLVSKDNCIEKYRNRFRKKFRALDF